MTRHVPSLAVGMAAATSLLFIAAGVFLSRPDLVVVALPCAGWLFIALQRRSVIAAPSVTITPVAGPAPGEVTSTIDVSGEQECEVHQVSVRTLSGHRYELALAPGETATITSSIFHSGPMIMSSTFARSLDIDGAHHGAPTDELRTPWHAAPAPVPVAAMPTVRRLMGLHGAHHGARLGEGGEFRDLHPFTAGDSLRRIDPRATARLARQPGEFYVRRTHTLSDTSVTIVVDTADDLAAHVAQWGSADVARTGETSLDLARSAARAVAEATEAIGDRIAYVVLAMRGRQVPSGAGRRHLARVLAAVAATGLRQDETTYARTPPIPTGSTVVLLSTFFDGDASRLALTWIAGGHRVIGIDTLPEPALTRLTPAQRFAADVVFTEREAVLRRLRASGVEIMSWSIDPATLTARMAEISRSRR